MSTETETTAEPLTTEQFHRQLASDLFNYVWALMEKTDRTCADNDRMIHAAHASRLHWEFGGSVVNFAIGEWQVSRVHAMLRQPDSAIYHARRYLEMAESYSLGPFHVAYAHEAIARALSGTDPARAAEHLERAREHTGLIEDADDRHLVEAELATIVITPPAAEA